jgi:hypothetical protein
MRNAKKSVSTSVPEGVRNVVSRTFVPGRYRRVDSYSSSSGAIRKNPAFAQSRIRAKTGRAAKRWNVHQSTEPSFDTSAPEWQSDSSA